MDYQRIARDLDACMWLACGRLLLLLVPQHLVFHIQVLPPPPRERESRQARLVVCRSARVGVPHASTNSCLALTDNRISMISHITHVYAMSSFDHGW